MIIGGNRIRPEMRICQRVPAARRARVVPGGLPSQGERAQGRPGARCTRDPVCNGTKKCAHEHTGPAESIRPSPRNGLTAYGALFPETNSSCLRHRRIDGFANPVGPRENLRRFDTSHGCQNHTLLPYAITPLVLRGSIAHSPKTKPQTALQHLARAGASRPPLPALHVS